MLGLFLLGLFIPISNSKGAFCGAILGLCFPTWLLIGSIVFEINKNRPIKSFPPAINCSNNDSLNNLIITGLPDKSGLVLLYSISYTWYTLLSILIVLMIGTIVSYATGKIYLFMLKILFFV